VDICREKNISAVTYHRWRKQFGHLNLNEAKRLKELERENTELKKMLADSLLKNRVLEAINAKNGKPGTQATDGGLRDRRGPVFRAGGMPVPAAGTRKVSLPSAAAGAGARQTGDAPARAVAPTSALRVSPHRGRQRRLR